MGGINYAYFLQAEHPEEVLLAILADFGEEPPERIAHALVQRLHETAKTPLNFQRYTEQLRVLSNLRNLQPLIDVIMEKISEFFVEARDPLYKKAYSKASSK